MKSSVARLVTILFTELEKLVPTIHLASVYALLSEFPGAHQIAGAHLTHLKSVLSDASKGRYDRHKAIEIRDAARNSIGSKMPAKSLELKHTIQLIQVLDAELESRIRRLPRKEASRGKALQCCHIPRCQETCAANLRHGEIRRTLQTACYLT